MTHAMLTEALTILEYLNKKYGKRYPKHLARHIADQLEAGYTTDECKAVIDLAWTQLRYKEHMSFLLRPTSLFGVRFAEWVGEIPAPKPVREPAEPLPIPKAEDMMDPAEVHALLDGLTKKMTL